MLQQLCKCNKVRQGGAATTANAIKLWTKVIKSQAKRKLHFWRYATTQLLRTRAGAAARVNGQKQLTADKLTAKTHTHSQPEREREREVERESEAATRCKRRTMWRQRTANLWAPIASRRPWARARRVSYSHYIYIYVCGETNRNSFAFFCRRTRQVGRALCDWQKGCH